MSFEWLIKDQKELTAYITKDNIQTVLWVPLFLLLSSAYCQTSQTDFGRYKNLSLDTSTISLHEQNEYFLDFDEKDTTTQGWFTDFEMEQSKNHFRLQWNRIGNKLEFLSLSDSKTWRQIGLDSLDGEYFIQFIELNGHYPQEIVVSTGPNMNGNRWKRIFCFSEDFSSIRYCGAYHTDFKLDTCNWTMSVNYNGSWYMDMIKSRYAWVHGNQVLLEQLVLIPSQKRGRGIEWLERWTNPKRDLTSPYKRIFRRKYGSKLDIKYWNTFLDWDED